jgi:hypothetical protein
MTFVVIWKKRGAGSPGHSLSVLSTKSWTLALTCWCVCVRVCVVCVTLCVTLCVCVSRGPAPVRAQLCVAMQRPRLVRA